MPVPVLYICSALLLVALFPMPYGYYILLRIVVCAVSIWSGIEAHKKGASITPWIFAVIAILYNPIEKIHLSKELWMPINIATAIIILSSIKKLKKSAQHVDAPESP